ncbi:MAG: DUF4113 domain-containing protein [Haliscomenobacteraceae bacterium CHB4]|nr:DUF4113 domain-containing protein [Haliscomenobacteraceae bacterium CHB4]
MRGRYGHGSISVGTQGTANAWKLRQERLSRRKRPAKCVFSVNFSCSTFAADKKTKSCQEKGNRSPKSGPKQ